MSPRSYSASAPCVLPRLSSAAAEIRRLNHSADRVAVASAIALERRRRRRRRAAAGHTHRRAPPGRRAQRLLGIWLRLAASRHARSRRSPSAHARRRNPAQARLRAGPPARLRLELGAIAPRIEPQEERETSLVRPSQREVRIEEERFVDQLQGGRGRRDEVPDRAPCSRGTARMRRGFGAARDPLIFVDPQSDLERLHHLARDVLLDREDIFELASVWLDQR